MLKLNKDMVSTKTANKQAEKPGNKSDMTSFAQQSLFVVTLLNMTWQLAIAVLVPVIGGFYLDQYFSTEPWFLASGIALAAVAVIGVMIGTVKRANKQAARLLKQSKESK